MQAGELNCKMSLYEYLDNATAEDDEEDEVATYVKMINAKITPMTGSDLSMTGDSTELHITHKIRIRKGAFTPSKRKYLQFEGQIYNIKYWQPIYKNTQYMEILTEMVVDNA